VKVPESERITQPVPPRMSAENGPYDGVEAMLEHTSECAERRPTGSSRPTVGTGIPGMVRNCEAGAKESAICPARGLIPRP
jgi:hypothetical protein